MAAVHLYSAPRSPCYTWAIPGPYRGFIKKVQNVGYYDGTIVSE